MDETGAHCTASFVSQRNTFLHIQSHEVHKVVQHLTPSFGIPGKKKKTNQPTNPLSVEQLPLTGARQMFIHFTTHMKLMGLVTPALISKHIVFSIW